MTKQILKMKTNILIILGLSIASLYAAEPLPADLLRQGLFEEEANRNLEKAAEHFRAVIAAHDRQRSVAASATFRLGEISRKMNDKEGAVAAFRTVIERFPEQQELARISRENLVALGVETAAPSPPTTGTNKDDNSLLVSIVGKSWRNEKGKVLKLLPDGLLMVVNRPEDGTDPKHKYEILNGDLKGLRIHWWNGDSTYEVKEYALLDGVNIIKNIRDDSDFWFIQKSPD